MSGRRRAISIGVRICTLAVSIAAVALAAPTFAALHANDAAALVVSLAIFTLLLRINVPAPQNAYRRRRRFEPGRLTIELPVVLTIATVYGPIAAAAIELLGYPLAAPADGRSRLTRRILDGGVIAFFWVCIAGLETVLPYHRAPLTLAGFGAFVGAYTIALYVYFAAVVLPLRALSTGTLLLRLYRNLTRDTRLLCFAVATIAWAFVCTATWLRAGLTLGLATFAPLPFLASALRALHNQRSELHRLRLARDAVQAMLGARDPLPQMNSLLGSLHTPSAEETLQIYAAISPEDARLAPLASIGPAPNAAQFEACRRALLDLQRNDSATAKYRTNAFLLTAYSVRGSEDELLGALVVHRPARTAALVPARRFLGAAAELAPLLRDFRSIAATQSLAAHDALTGLPNRRTIMEQLRQCVESVSVSNDPCAVLLIDIDRFKSINDTLGHQAGDRVLQMVGSVISRNIRGVDRAGRIGGEEFAIMMPDTASETAVAIGERLRTAIEAAELRHATGEPVTASIGVAVASVSDTVDSLLARADRALYQAKHQGRNRVVELGA